MSFHRQWCGASFPRPAEVSNVTASYSSKVKVLVHAKAKTRSSPMANSMSQRDTVDNTTHTYYNYAEGSTKQFSQADKLARLLAGGCKQRDTRFFPASVWLSPKKITCILILQVKWIMPTSPGKDDIDEYLITTKPGIWLEFTNFLSASLNDCQELIFCSWSTKVRAKLLQDQIFWCGSLLFPVRLVDAGDLGY